MTILAPSEHAGIRPTGVPAVKLGGPPGIGGTVIAELRAADARLGMRPPTAPQRPDRETVLRLLRAHVRQARFYVAQYDVGADAIEAALAELVALAPFAAMLAEVIARLQDERRALCALEVHLDLSDDALSALAGRTVYPQVTS